MSGEKHFNSDPTAGLPDLPEGVWVRAGGHEGRGHRVGIVAARFNMRLTGALVKSAVETLADRGVEPDGIAVQWVPGSYEIPLALKRLHKDIGADALIACGVVIEGETRHAEWIMRSLTTCFTDLSLSLDCPVIDAVVSARTPEQAEARCLGGSESRGAYAALAALECSTRF